MIDELIVHALPKFMLLYRLVDKLQVFMEVGVPQPVPQGVNSCVDGLDL